MSLRVKSGRMWCVSALELEFRTSFPSLVRTTVPLRHAHAIACSIQRRFWECSSPRQIMGSRIAPSSH